MRNAFLDKVRLNQDKIIFRLKVIKIKTHRRGRRGHNMLFLFRWQQDGTWQYVQYQWRSHGCHLARVCGKCDIIFNYIYTDTTKVVLHSSRLD